MPNVSGTDSSANYAAKQIQDLNDELRAERKKALEREDQRVADIQRKHQAEMRERDENSLLALSRSREAAHSALDGEKKNALEAYDRLKRDTYDRFGKINREQFSDSNRKIAELQEQIVAEQKRKERETRSADELHQSQMLDHEQESSLKVQKALLEERQKMEDTYANFAKNNYDYYTRKLDDESRRTKDLDKRRLSEFSELRDRYEEKGKIQQQDYDRRLDATKYVYEKSKLGSANQLRMSHAKEVTTLKNQLDELIDHDRKNARDLAQAKSDMVREYETQWKDKITELNDTQKKEVQDLRNQTEQTEIYLSNRKVERVGEIEGNTSKILNEERNAHRSSLNRAIASMEAENKQNKEDFAKLEEFQAKKSADGLENQANEFTKTLHQQEKVANEDALASRKELQEEITEAQRALQERVGSKDLKYVSPGAEASIRRQVAAEYEKNLQTERERKEKESEEIRSHYQKRFADVATESREKEIELNRALIVERQDHRQELIQSYADMEFAKDTVNQRKDQDFEHLKDDMYKNHARALESERRDHEDSIRTIKNSGEDKLHNLRADQAFSQKVLQREFSMKMNDTIRDYEKRLNDQRSEFQSQIDDLKADSITAARDNDRKTKTLLTEQQKAYEQKFTQQELSFKEKERYLEQNFEDQLDRLKRSNALLAQKRG